LRETLLAPLSHVFLIIFAPLKDFQLLYNMSGQEHVESPRHGISERYFAAA
jgi:hypothetical protein